MPVQPFSIDIPQSTLDDLHMRLTRARLSSDVEEAGWDYGTNSAYLQELLTYWRDTFDWRQQESTLNTFAHFKATIDGIGIHFIHERGKGPNPVPILLSHGWPDSFVRMLDIVPLLTDPAAHGGNAEDAFDVIVPSIPGYGFSDKPKKPGMTPEKIAELFHRLMHEELGYEKYAAHGGDVGSGITQELGLSHGDSLVGIHLTDVPYLNQVRAMGKVKDLSEDEQDYMRRGQEWGQTESGYAIVQSTKPQTLAHALNDSPAGLASWIVTPFRTWSDCDGDIERRFSKDQLLTNIAIYWVTETIGSSFLTYSEPGHQQTGDNSGIGHVEVPTGFASFPKDLVPAPREWAERFFNVTHWTEMPRGGHFAAMEEPELLVEDIRAFLRPLRA